MEAKTIARARLLLGALLLFAALVTWGIGLTLDSHGKAVLAGTEHVRSTVVTFKHNGAIGTLILSSIAGWLLFPGWRSKWLLRDWALVVLLAVLATSSLYTLASLRPSTASAAEFDENLATTYDNDLNPSGVVRVEQGSTDAAAAVAQSRQISVSGTSSGATRDSNKRSMAIERARLSGADVESQANRTSEVNSGGDDAPTPNAPETNQE